MGRTGMTSVGDAGIECRSGVGEDPVTTQGQVQPSPQTRILHNIIEIIINGDD